jgi:hypothetical protein
VVRASEGAPDEKGGADYAVELDSLQHIQC